LRRIAMPLLARLNPGDITIRHHHAARPFHLHSFRHRGYWFHGPEREKASMAAFRRLIRPGHTVLEIGGHIGYVSVFFSRLAGETGRVFVFEPGPDNLPYLRRNVGGLGNVEVIERAVGEFEGRATLYAESLTGQNNSLLPDFRGFRKNREAAHLSHLQIQPVAVDVTTLDRFVRERSIAPDFIKIDIEGYEWPALRGMAATLASCRPILMVEVQENAEAVFAFLREHGYSCYTPEFEPIETPGGLSGNIFCLQRERHGRRLAIAPSGS